MYKYASGGGEFGQWYTFKTIFEYIDTQLLRLQNNLLDGISTWATMLFLFIVTFWIMYQGVMIATGRSREPLAAIPTHALRLAFVSSVAMVFTHVGGELNTFTTQTLPRLAMGLISGNYNDDPFQRINENLEVVGTTFALLNTAAQSKGGLDAAMNQVFVAASVSSIGTAGPAIIGGALILVYKTAIALFIGFGPLFILCYGFPSTKHLASKWLYYGIGTLFSMALLSFMVAVVTKVVVAVGLMMIAKYAILVTLQGADALEGINTMAMQQGGLGLVMTVLLISCPPLAASFFNATVGQFSAYSQFGIERGGGQRDANGNPIGGGSNRLATQVERDGSVRNDPVPSYNTRTTQYSQENLQRDAIKTEQEVRNRRV